MLSQTILACWANRVFISSQTIAAHPSLSVMHLVSYFYNVFLVTTVAKQLAPADSIDAQHVFQ
jgi:hypothetical protein